jgi:hypothetical protein
MITKLPIKEPIVKGYKHHALPLSILQAKDETIFQSLLPYYLQLYTTSDVLENPNCDVHWLDFCIYEYLTEMRPNAYFDAELVDRKSVGSTDKMKALIIECMASNQYIYTNYDGYYLPNNLSYKREYFINNLLIHGYDSDNNQCYVYDYDYVSSNRLIEFAVDMDALCAAITSIPDDAPDWTNRMMLLRPVPAGAQVSLQRDHIVRSLHDYLHASPTFDRFAELRAQGHSVMSLQQNPVYGIDTLQVLLKYTENIFPEMIYPNQLPFCILMEHKKVMEMGLETLGIKREDPLIREAAEVSNLSNIILNYAIKYLLNRNRNIIKRIADGLRELEVKERTYLNKLLSQLSKEVIHE